MSHPLALMSHALITLKKIDLKIGYSFRNEGNFKSQLVKKLTIELSL